MIKSIKKEHLAHLWERLASNGPLYLPVKEGPALLFKPWREGAAVDLETVSSTVSPKEVFLPRDEVYMQFSRAGQKLELHPAVQEPAGRLIAFGLRSCDLRAVELLDMVFCRKEPVDEPYAARRENTTLVALACGEPDPFCFCTAFGVDPVNAPGADVQAWWNRDDLVLEAETARGEALFTLAGELLAERNAVDRPERPATTDFSLPLEGLPKRLKERFDDPAWGRLYRSCIGCGACTYVCPTCHCFDVQDFGHHARGQRFRCWDSCMYKEFTVMAGGHNPRLTRKERVRQRFLHKLQYFPENYGVYACVGCGRCLRSCPVNLDVVQAIRALGGETVEQR
ncbi:MAG: 4Fe-4S dicluster domain-containing protein [Bacillota bacterium]